MSPGPFTPRFGPGARRQQCQICCGRRRLRSVPRTGTHGAHHAPTALEHQGTQAEPCHGPHRHEPARREPGTRLDKGRMPGRRTYPPQPAAHRRQQGQRPTSDAELQPAHQPSGGPNGPVQVLPRPEQVLTMQGSALAQQGLAQLSAAGVRSGGPGAVRCAHCRTPFSASTSRRNSWRVAAKAGGACRSDARSRHAAMPASAP